MGFVFCWGNVFEIIHLHYSPKNHTFDLDITAAQRNGSAAAAGPRDSLSIIAHFWQADAVVSGRAAVRLEPVLGGALFTPLVFLGTT